jgi:hypothetical protein
MARRKHTRKRKRVGLVAFPLFPDDRDTLIARVESRGWTYWIQEVGQEDFSETGYADCGDNGYANLVIDGPTRQDVQDALGEVPDWPEWAKLRENSKEAENASDDL